MDWFRSWHGAPMDSKWIVVARRAGVTPGEVSAVFWALLDYASQQADRGSVAGFDAEIYAAWAGWDESTVVSILSAMRAKGVITDDDLLAAWEKRQPNREDSSAERVRRHRERKSAESVTLIESAVVTQCNAPVTQCNAPEKIREDQDRGTGIDLSSGVAGADLQSSGADAPGAVGASVPLSLQFREITDALRAEGANRPAILRGWYIACFGDSGDVPDFSRFGQVAKLVGGAGRLAERIMELSARPPTGDVLAYIQAETRNSKAERRPARAARAAGGPAATADWEIAARAVGADGALDAGADAQPVRAPAGPVVAGDPDLVAVLADMGIDGIAGVWRAGETPEGVPVVRVEYAGDHAWFGRKGVVALRKRIAPVIGAAPVFDVQGVAA